MGKEIRGFFWTWKCSISNQIWDRRKSYRSRGPSRHIIFSNVDSCGDHDTGALLEPPVAPARFSGRSYSSQVSLWRSSSRTFFTGQPTSDRSPSPHLTGPEIRVLGRVMGSPKKGFLFARLMFCLSFPIIVGSFCEGWRGSNTQHSSIVIT